MPKKLWLVVSLLIVLTVVAACGGSDNSAELEAAKAAAATAEAELAAAKATAAEELAAAQSAAEEAKAAAESAAASGSGASAEELEAAKAAAAAAEAMAAEAEAKAAEAEAKAAEAEAARMVAEEAAAAAAADGGEVARPVPADGMITCSPLPDMPTARVSAGLASPVVNTASQTAQANRPAQQSGGVYQVGVFEDVTTLNFWAANGPDNTVWNSYMLPPRPAMYGLGQQRFDFIPDVAAALPDPLTEEGEFWVVEIPIRDDIVWSDGEAFTAEDVAFTANAVVNLGLISGNWAQWYDKNLLDHVEAVDDTTVKYYYHTKPGLARHEWGTLQAPILPEHYWGPKVEEALDPIEALSAEPSEEDLLVAQAEAHDILFTFTAEDEPFAEAYLYGQWEPGAFFESPANADYYGANVDVTLYANGAYEDSTGLTIGDTSGDVELEYSVGPFVDSAIYSIYSTQDAAILALQNGEVDFLLNSLGLQRGLADRIKGDPNLTVFENPSNGFRYLSFNNRRQPMNDCAFRQAMAVLIDKEFVTQTILQNVAIPLYTYVPEANGAWYSDDVPKLGQGMDRQQRLEMAIAILEQAGYSWENDQKPTWDEGGGGQVVPSGRLLMPNGSPLPKLELWAPSPGYDSLRSTFAIWIETWANEVGIPVEANLAGFNVLIPRLFTEQDFDMYILGWSLGLFPDFLNDFFNSEQAVPDGNNAGGYANPEFDELAEAILTCDSQESCKEIADNLQQILSTETPYVLLFTTPVIEAYRSEAIEFPYTDNLSGLQYSHTGGPLQNSVSIK